MGYKGKRPSTRTGVQLTQAQKDLLDTQELTATLFETNAALQAQLLDTQEILASIVEGGNV